MVTKQQINMFLPLGLVMMINKLKLEEMDVLPQLRIGYVVAQLLCLAVLFFIRTKIVARPASEKKIKIPEQKAMGQVVKPAREMSPKDYDLDRWMEDAKKIVIQSAILGLIHYKWEVIMPLALQTLLSPWNLFQSPLVEVYLLGKEVTRPYPVENPFGDMMGGEEEKEVEDKKASSKAVSNVTDSTTAEEEIEEVETEKAKKMK